MGPLEEPKLQRNWTESTPEAMQKVIQSMIQVFKDAGWTVHGTGPDIITLEQDRKERAMKGRYVHLRLPRKIITK